MDRDRRLGHVAALFTIFVWGTTFISTKVLLTSFEPVEILFIRFALGFVALWVACPRRLKVGDWKREGTFCLAGLSGVCLYYLLENIALTYTQASNVGVIISVAPVFTAILTHLFFKGEERLRPSFFCGFLVAMAGICLISFNGARLALAPLGDLLALGAALVWACYAVLTRVLGGYGYGTVQTTRRVFGYGLLFMLPALLLFPIKMELDRFFSGVNLLNLLFLGFGASALCFVTWNHAVKVLGAVRTSVYIYLVPVITVVTSVAVLYESVTPVALAGTGLILVGLFLSEWNPRQKQTA